MAWPISTALAHRLNLRLVATGNVHYLSSEDAPLHDILTCIRHRVPLDQANGLLRSNAEYFFRSPPETAALFAEWPDALQATLDIAERCHAHLPSGPQPLPAGSTPNDAPTLEYLRQLCEIGLTRKCDHRALNTYRATLDRELSIITE